jgi:hypothetical membrane protein
VNTKLVRLFAIFGMLAPILGIVIIFTSITIAPAFKWDKNAISDLGVGGFEAVIFNSGMGMTAAVMMLFSACLFEYTKGSNIGLAGAAIHLVGSISLLGVGIANKNVEPWHLVAAISLFVAMPLSSLVMGLYQYKRGDYIFPILAVICSAVAIGVWFAKWPSIALPEMISISSMTVWQILFAYWIRLRTHDSEPSLLGIKHT